jgi:DNA polymerase-1
MSASSTGSPDAPPRRLSAPNEVLRASGSAAALGAAPDGARVYLVDASVYIFRAYYSELPEMTDRDGHAAHAVFGFARFLCDVIEAVRPTHIAVAFDQSLASSFRNRIYPAYKANREPAPPGLLLQFERCRELCGHLGVASFISPEYEADDIIGTLVTITRGAGMRAVVITRDKDLAQLIRCGDHYWDYGHNARCGYGEVADRFGVMPERFADYLALTGDSVDNIRGVPGIGPKTAAALMKEFACLEEIYTDLERVAQLKLRGAAAIVERLRAHRADAFLARDLTRIACDMPLEADAGSLRRRPPDARGLAGFYDQHQFGPSLRRQSERLAQIPCA